MTRGAGTRTVRWAPSSAAPSFFRHACIPCGPAPPRSLPHPSPPHAPQHWCSGFESALSSVLVANRDAEASSSLQLQTEIQSRDRTISAVSQQLEQLRSENSGVVAQLAAAAASSDREVSAAREQARQAQGSYAEADARCRALESKLEEQTKRHEEYAGFIAEVGARRPPSPPPSSPPRRQRP